MQAAAGGGGASGPGAHRLAGRTGTNEFAGKNEFAGGGGTSGWRRRQRVEEAAAAHRFHGTVAGKNEFADEGHHDLPR